MPIRNTRHHLWVTGTLIASLALAIAGCEQIDAPGPAEQNAFITMIDSAIQDAISEGASEEQIAALRVAREAGVVTPEMERQALLSYGECANKAGLEFAMGDTSGNPDFPRFEYTVAVPREVSVDVMDECYNVHAAHIDTVYQVQPAMARAQLDLVNSKRVLIISCLQEAGVDIDNEATIDEVRDEVYRGLLGTAFGEVPSTDPTFPIVDCAGPVGLQLSDFSY